ncbi:MULTISPECIES: NAD(P)/FAD-dependent oxidoreductase [unclassified Meiothermus]|uniref:flavin monoamine oxidase family protein n=1 Tax=unclassified Meiothermus TaxID=370471 RepID=UPI0013145650|nr:MULTISPECIES: NAD(P)/FAD-dependent oxidoreductase [unclassified Meiothermus]
MAGLDPERSAGSAVFPPLDIRLGVRVEVLEWGGFGVKAISADGRVYFADQAVVTLPLGVLKARQVRFIPELPAEKLEALALLGVADAVKLFYHFDHPIFPPGINELYVPGANPDEWWSSSRGHGVKIEILTSLATGPKARELLRMPQEQALQKGLETLRQALGQPHLTPSKAHLVHWRDDPLALGAYSKASVGASGARAILAKPVAGRLFFAGEHTASNAWAATVHGAYASGRRAAREILAMRGLPQAPLPHARSQPVYPS